MPKGVFLTDRTLSSPVAGGSGKPADFLGFLKDAGVSFVQRNAGGAPLPGMHAVFQAEMLRPNAPATDISAFPEPTQRLLRDMADLADIEKVTLINLHVNSAIKYSDQYGHDPSPSQTAAQTLKSGDGDCDDAAYVKAVLLKHAGIAEERIHVTGVRSRYAFPGKAAGDPERSTGSGLHAVTIVAVDGKFMSMDGLTDDVRPLEADDGHFPVLTSFRSSGVTLRNQPEEGPGEHRVMEVVSVGTLSGAYFAPEDDRYSHIQPRVQIGEPAPLSPSVSSPAPP